MVDRSLIVIAYDIGDDRRRAKLAQLLLGYGARVEASVYELWLTAREVEKLWHDLTQMVKDSDIVRCYTLCDTCVRRVRSSNLSAPHDPIAFFA